MSRAGLVVVLLVILLAPAARSERIEGDLSLQRLRIETFASGTLAAHALFAGDTTNLSALALTTRLVEVDVWRAEYAEARASDPLAVGLSISHASYRLEDVVVSLRAEGRHAGWLGLRDAGAAHVTLAPASEVLFRNEGRIGFAMASSMEPEDQPTFTHALYRPHMLVDQCASFTTTGSGFLRILGPDITILSRTNTTHYDTGWTRDDAPLGQAQVVWVQLAWDEGSLDMQGIGDTQVQASSAALAWSGRASLGGLDGSLTGASSTWSAANKSVYVDGDLSFSLVSANDALEGTLSGELLSTTLARSTRVATVPAVSAPITGIVLLGAGAVVGAAAVAVIMRRRKDPAWTVEELMDFAAQAMDLEDHERALAWIRRARGASPLSTRVKLEHAYILQASGKHDEARGMLRDLVDTDSSAEACWVLARLLAQQGAHRDDVLPLLLQALDGEPTLALNIDEDEILRPFLASPRLSKAVEDALRALD